MASFVAAGGYDMLAGVLPRIVDAIAAFSGDITILVDDFEVVRSAECSEQVDFFVSTFRTTTPGIDHTSRPNLATWPHARRRQAV